jgi:hypothetical protein
MNKENRAPFMKRSGGLAIVDQRIPAWDSNR